MARLREGGPPVPGSPHCYFAAKLLSRMHQLSRFPGTPFPPVLDLLVRYYNNVLPEVCERASGPIALCHMDLCTRNVMVEPKAGTVTGLLDWENGGAFPLEMDLFNMCFHFAPEHAELLKAEWFGDDAPDAGFPARYHLNGVLALLNKIVWAKGVLNHATHTHLQELAQLLGRLCKEEQYCLAVRVGCPHTHTRSCASLSCATCTARVYVIVLCVSVFCVCVL